MAGMGITQVLCQALLWRTSKKSKLFTVIIVEKTRSTCHTNKGNKIEVFLYYDETGYLKTMPNIASRHLVWKKEKKNRRRNMIRNTQNQTYKKMNNIEHVHT